jgi:hypothetical protein
MLIETDPATKIFLKSLNKPFIREIDDYSVFIMEESNGQYTLEERVQQVKQWVIKFKNEQSYERPPDR